MNVETESSKQKMSDIRKVGMFFILTITISWIIWSPLLFLKEGLFSTLILIGGGYGPFLSAILVTWKMEGRTELRIWLRRTFRWRINMGWYLLAAFLLPIGMAMLHVGLYRLLGGQTHFSNVLLWLGYPIGLVIVVLLFGGQEEPGWRGFAVPKLLTKYSPIVTSFIIAPIWMAWHLPLYLTAGWSGSEQPLLWFLLYALGLSLIMTWLYLKSSRSVLPVMLLHAATNQVFNYFPMETVIFRSLAYDFDVLKTVVYWAIAILLLLTTSGRLGWRADTAAGSSEAALS